MLQNLHVLLTCEKVHTSQCIIPCACHAKRHLNVQKCSEPPISYTFDFGMCFAPQRHALFRHLDFQKWSEHNGVQFFISHLTTWLRTRGFSESTFRPSGATNHWKNTVFRDFPTFSRSCIFCLLTLSLF